MIRFSLYADYRFSSDGFRRLRHASFDFLLLRLFHLFILL